VVTFDLKGLEKDLAASSWDQLETCYGPPINAPKHLRAFFGSDVTLQNKAFSYRSNIIVHQGTRLSNGSLNGFCNFSHL
jgi:hypothetical protein